MVVFQTLQHLISFLKNAKNLIERAVNDDIIIQTSVFRDRVRSNAAILTKN